MVVVVRVLEHSAWCGVRSHSTLIGSRSGSSSFVYAHRAVVVLKVLFTFYIFLKYKKRLGLLRAWCVKNLLNYKHMYRSSSSSSSIFGQENKLYHIKMKKKKKNGVLYNAITFFTVWIASYSVAHGVEVIDSRRPTRRGPFVISTESNWTYFKCSARVYPGGVYTINDTTRYVYRRTRMIIISSFCWLGAFKMRHNDVARAGSGYSKNNNNNETA